jgi:predicted DsbA family dithiol-disulfide isomerase
MSSVSAGTAVELEIFSDVVCPWCYIGRTQLRTAVAGFAGDGGQVDLRFRPYLLDPDQTGPSRPLLQKLADRFGMQSVEMLGRVTKAGASVGLDLRMDEAIAADSRPAHQLIEAAWSAGGVEQQSAVVDRLFAAYFTEGRDIADRAVLTSIGDDVGLSPAVVLDALDGAASAAAVAAGLSEAAALGITAVPTFVANRALGIQGAQSADVLREFLVEAASTQPA